MTPSVENLITDPLVAVLHILDVTVETAVTALTAAHADVLWQDELPGLVFERPPSYTLLRAAEEILQHAENLRGAIASYTPDLTPPWERNPSLLGISDDLEVPF